jgi:hypothetical protein
MMAMASVLREIFCVGQVGARQVGTIQGRVPEISANDATGIGAVEELRRARLRFVRRMNDIDQWNSRFTGECRHSILSSREWCHDCLNIASP